MTFGEVRAVIDEVVGLSIDNVVRQSLGTYWQETGQSGQVFSSSTKNLVVHKMNTGVMRDDLGIMLGDPPVFMQQKCVPVPVFSPFDFCRKDRRWFWLAPCLRLCLGPCLSLGGTRRNELPLVMRRPRNFGF